MKKIIVTAMIAELVLLAVLIFAAVKFEIFNLLNAAFAMVIVYGLTACYHDSQED